MIKRYIQLFKEKINKPLLYGSFTLFILILIWVVFFKGIEIINSKEHISDIISPIVTQDIFERLTYQFYRVDHKPFDYVPDVIRNLLIMLPLGIYLPLLFNKTNLLRDSLITLLIILFIETFQLFTGIGCFEYSDIVSNYLGFLMGYFIYKVLSPKISNLWINIICLLIIISVLPFTIYAYIKVIDNFEIFLPCFNIENYNNLFDFH